MDIIDYRSSQSDSQRPPAFKVFTNVTTITDSRDFQEDVEEPKTTTVM